MKEQANNPFRSASRAFSILMSFAPENKEKTIAEIGSECGFLLPTASRLVHMLVDQEFLLCNPWTKKYSLGKAVFDLGMSLIKSLRGNLAAIAKPYIDKLRDDIEMDVGLEVLLGNSTVLAYVAFGRRRVNSHLNIGDRMPVHVAAGAKAIMAFSAPEVVDWLLEGDLERLTPNTITDKEVLKRKLAEFRKKNLAFDLGEGDVDLHVVAAPIFDYEKKPVAAVTTGGFAHKIRGRFDPEIISLLRKTADSISSRLFYEAGKQMLKEYELDNQL